MKEASYKQLIKIALQKGYTVSVWDGEDWAVKRGCDADEIIEAIDAVEEAEIKIHDGRVSNWALIIPYGVAPDETIADYSCTGTMEDLLEFIEGE